MIPKPSAAGPSTSTQLVAPGFESVATAFYRTIAAGKQAGAALSIWLDGAPVVELTGGVADKRTGRVFAGDTLVNVFSCTKGMASVLVAMLVEEGTLPNYDTPIADVWPEFGVHGKDRITIGDALAHRAGISGPRFTLTPEQILDPLMMADILAAQEPLWEPGRTHQYHGITHGALTAKLVSIATKQDIGSIFAERIAGPLNADVWIGLPASEHHRVVHLCPDPTAGQEAPASAASDGVAGDPIDYLTGTRWADPAVWKAQIPGAGGIATAAGLARVWSATVVPTEGVRLLSDKTVENLQRRRSEGPAFIQGPPLTRLGAPELWCPQIGSPICRQRPLDTTAPAAKWPSPTRNSGWASRTSLTKWGTGSEVNPSSPPFATCSAHQIDRSEYSFGTG
ncbi:serine hydrolase domain-containing protein [Arthrobacter sp. SA17]